MLPDHLTESVNELALIVVVILLTSFAGITAAALLAIAS